MTHEERRADPRVDMDISVSAQTAEGEALELRTDDLSVGGACLTGVHLEKLRVGSRMTLDLPMPGAAPIRAEAEVRWASSGKVGVRFDDAAREALAGLV